MKNSSIVFVTLCLSCVACTRAQVSDSGDSPILEYCSIDLFNLRGVKCSEMPQNGQRVYLEKGKNMIVINVERDGENPVVQIIKGDEGKWSSQEIFDEEDGLIRVNVSTYFSDSVISMIIKKTDKLSGNVYYVLKMIYKYKMEVYEFDENFNFDTAQIANSSYLAQHSFSHTNSIFKMQNDNFVIESKTIEKSEIGKYNVKRIFNVKDYGLCDCNIRTIDDAIFWYLFHLKL